MSRSAALIASTWRSTLATNSASELSRYMMWRPMARSGASIWSMNPAATIASYSTVIASPIAARYSSSVP